MFGLENVENQDAGVVTGDCILYGHLSPTMPALHTTNMKYLYQLISNFCGQLSGEFHIVSQIILYYQMETSSSW